MTHPPVSLLTVTNRDRQYIALAVAQGKAQDYAGLLEHIVVYNVAEEDKEKPDVRETVEYLEGQANLADHGQCAVRPLRIIKEGKDKDITLGELRNRGIEHCRGEYIVVWDDDDLYDHRRVTVQVKAAQAEGKSASTFDSLVVHETENRAIFKGSERRSYLMHWRNTGWEPTLCCKKELIKNFPYEHENTGEDTPVLKAIYAQDAVNVIKHGPGEEKMYIYMRQGKPTVAAAHESKWFDLRQITYDFNDVLGFALKMQPPTGPRLTKEVLKPFLKYGSARFPRPPPYGKLSVKGGRIVGESGEPARLHGVSLPWSPWKAQFWKYDVVKWLNEDWRVNIIRAPMAVEQQNGFFALPEVNVERVDEVVQACLASGVYVIIGWYSENVFSSTENEQKAINFFASIAEKYGRFPHVIFEPWSCPQKDEHSWSDIKAYHEEVIDAIRGAHCEENLIVVSGPGCASISQDMIKDPIRREGPVALSLHAYMTDSSTLEIKIREASLALEKGCALMETEWGAGTNVNKGCREPSESTYTWLAFLKQTCLCHIVWGLSDFVEPNAVTKGKWLDGKLTELWSNDKLTAVGQFVRTMHREYSLLDGRSWQMRRGLPNNEGKNHPSIDPRGITTIEDMRKTCMSYTDCVGFAYRPAQTASQGHHYDQSWFPKQAGTGFDPVNATYRPHHLGEQWEWHYIINASTSFELAYGTVRNKNSDKNLDNCKEVVLWNLEHEEVEHRMSNGDQVTIVDSKDDEFKVIWRGTQGWVKKWHIQTKDSL